jgi:predicted Zn-dependent peptidase
MEFAGSAGGLTGETYTTDSVFGSAGNVRAMLSHLREGVDTGRAEVQQVGKWVKDTRKDRVKDEKKPETWAERGLWEQVFPGHVVSRWATDAELEVRKAFTGKDANGLIDRTLQPANAVLLVVGNFDGERAEADVRTLFGDWAPRKGVAVGKAPGVAPAPEPPVRKILIYPKEGTTQAQVDLLCQLPQPTFENWAPRQVLASAYSDVLYLELRETAGSTYGAWAYQTEQRGGIAYLAAGTLIQDKSVDLAIKTMLETLGTLAEKGIEQDKLQLFKWDLARGVTVGNQTTGQVLGTLEGYASRGWPLDSTQQVGPRIAAVSNADLHPLLERCVGHEVITLVGSKEDMLREVQEAGHTAEVVDWEQWVEQDEKKK